MPMWISLGLSVALLVNVPFFGRVDVQRMLRSRHTHPTAADSLPPPWRNASRLALENQFVQAELPDLSRGPGTTLRFNADPRDLHIQVDPDSGTLRTAPEFGDVAVGEGASWPLGPYGSLAMSRAFQRNWNKNSLANINSLGISTPQGPRQGGYSIALPRLPGKLGNLAGAGGPSINVSGSEAIRISGTSNWTNQQVGPLGQKRSLFPSLDMQQDLNIQLEGQLSDRIRVNLLQNSANQIPLSNRIAINYRGDEDALFQQVDLGNTNLTLPGTQYVSYSGKNEGLFGMKATSRLGPLDFTLLASKQEGRSERASYGGGASKQNSTIRDLEYIHGVYFFLNDPAEGRYEIADATLRVFMDDGISSNDVGALQLGLAMPDPTVAANVARVTHEADSLASYPPGSRDPGPLALRGNFNLLTPGADKDYEILGDIYGTGWKIIRLTQPLIGSQRLAVTYERRKVLAGNALGPAVNVGASSLLDLTTDRNGEKRLLMKLIRIPNDIIGPLAPGGVAAPFDTTKALFPVRELEMRNFYNLGGQRIDPTTFKLTIRKTLTEPPKVNANTTVGQVPYIEILGLDNLNESIDPPQKKAHDGKVDGTVLSSSLRTFIDYENGTLFFPEPRPFAPRLGPGGNAFDQAVSNILFRRDSLTGPQDSDTEPNSALYSHYNIQGDIDARYFMSVEFTAARASGEVSLGRGNLLEGSEVVTINGTALHRGTDYEIDYDLGRMTLKRQLGPADNLNVDYSYAPLFQQAGRTLIGSAFSLQGKDRSFGGAFMYESRGAQDLRPRLGEEPARSLIGDLNTDWMFRPQWMTRAIDMLPGVRTTAPSDFRFQAEVGASFPNPNTRNQVYIDDMEGVRDAVSLTMDQSHWRWSSVPKRAVTVSDGRAGIIESMLDVEDRADGHFKNAETHWYSPYAVVKEGDLKPTLTDAQGKQNTRQVLAISVPRRPLTSNSNPATLDTLWSGLTYSLDPVGLDLTKSQFLELWVNDFNDHHDPGTASPRIRGRHVKIHIDLGKVSEDQMRAPNERPNKLPDSEDKQPRDGQLDVTPGRNEDTGLDGLLDDEELTAITPVDGVYRDLMTSSSSDPEGDDFETPGSNSTFKEEIDARRYLRTNGTEKDKNLNPYPETEDFNLNGNLDTDENYFEYTIDLGDDAGRYLVTDLQQLRNSAEPGYSAVSIDNGWRRYRIPVNDSLRIQFGVPDLSIAQHVRVWLDGLTLPDLPADSTLLAGNKHVERPLLMLGSLDIVGSRWRSVALDTTEVRAGSTLTLNSVNSVDNADVYTAPFDPGQTRNGNQALTRREQSISLEFSRLHAQNEVEAYKTFSLDEDYSRYGKLNWYATGFDVHDSTGAIRNPGLYYFVRFASDEQGRNYYEYRAPLPVSAAPRGTAWQEVQLELTELSNIKLDRRFPTGRDTLFAVPRTAGSLDTLIVKGRPSFTRLRRISFGLVNLLPDGYYRDGQLWFNELRAIDVAKDHGYAERIAVNGRLANLFSYNLAWNGRDENFISVGESRGSGTATSSFGFSGNLDLHRFFEGTGIILPMTFNYSQGRQKPRYSAGDDIVRGNADIERSQTFTDNRSWGVSYSRTWSSRANPLLLYTVGGLTANYNASNSHSLSPLGGDQNNSSSGTLNYNIAPRNLLTVPLLLTKSKFHPLPERAYANYRFDRRDGQTSDRNNVTGGLDDRAPVTGKSGTINMGADTRPLDFYHHHIEAVRNTNLRAYDSKGKPIGLGLGRVITWNQTNDVSVSPHVLQWLRPQLSWNSRFGQNNGPELSQDLSIRSIQNGQQGTVSWELPFGNLSNANAMTRVQQQAPPDSGKARQKPHGPALWRQLTGRLGTIRGEFALNRGSSYSRVIGMPGPLYLFGLTSDPSISPDSTTRVTSVTGNQATTSTGWRTSGRTTVQLPWSMSAATSAEFETRFSTANGAERGSDQLRFPDITLDYGQMATVLKINKLIRNPQLRSALNRQVSKEYQDGHTVKTGVTTLTQYRPLLSLSGDLPNGMRLELGSEHRHSDRELLQLGSSLQQDINTDLNINLTRSYSQGQKVNFFGKESTVRSSITIGINSQYERQTGRIIQNGTIRNPVRRDRLSLNTTGSYGFSSNVSGNATLGFSQDRDQLRDIVHRSIRVELSARFGL